MKDEQFRVLNLLSDTHGEDEAFDLLEDLEEQYRRGEISEEGIMAPVNGRGELSGLHVGHVRGCGGLQNVFPSTIPFSGGTG